MNIASILIPKSMVTYLYDDFSFRQGLEKMRYHKRTAVPVVTRENQYVGTLSEGDFLWYLTDYMKNAEKNHKIVDFRDFETISLRELLKKDKNPPVRINTNYTKLLECALAQNFIPVIDDRDSFIGIVTRNALIKQLSSEVKQYRYEELFREQPLIQSNSSQ